MLLNTRLADIFKIVLSLSFILSGLMKGIDPYGTSLKIIEYCSQFGLRFSNDDAMILSVVLCSLEICIGMCILLNICLWPMLYISLILLAFFTLLLVIVSIVPELRVDDCGCFGDILSMSLSVSIAKNILLIGVAVGMLYLIKKGNIRYKQRKGVISTVVVLVLSICIPVYSAVRLPFIEFTEYGIGADLHNVKSFQLVNGEYANVTQKILDNELQILIVKKQEFTVKELGIVRTLTQSASEGQYNIDVIVGVSSENMKNELYCTENTLKMIARTPENAVIYLEKGIIKKKKKLWNIPNNLNN